MRSHPWNFVFPAGFIVYMGIRGVFKRRTKSNEVTLRRFDAIEKSLVALVTRRDCQIVLEVLFSSMMVPATEILDVCDRIVAKFRPVRIILFGSHAYGSPADDSDVDLLVVVAAKPDGYRKAAEISEQVRPSFALDLLVRTTADLGKRIALNDFFFKEIVEKGIVLYDATDARVGSKGRKRLQQRQTARTGAQVAGL
jgi:predicted nucleotidyltransferase